MTLAARQTPIRYALLSDLGLYFAPLGDTADARTASVAYTRDAAAARLNSIGGTGYTIVPVRIGRYRCYDCGGHGEWETGPGDWEVCSRCGGHGWGGKAAS